MKRLLTIVFIGLMFVGCENGGNSESDIREVVVERYGDWIDGDKKIVCYYKGEGSNEELVKKICYYNQSDGGGKENELNYKDGSISLSRWWYENGQLKYEINFNTGLNGIGHCLRSWYKNGQLMDEVYYNYFSQVISKKCWDENGNEKECELLY